MVLHDKIIINESYLVFKLKFASDFYEVFGQVFCFGLIDISSLDLANKNDVSLTGK